jgi:hypothetical protein
MTRRGNKCRSNGVGVVGFGAYTRLRDWRCLEAVMKFLDAFSKKFF